MKKEYLPELKVGEEISVKPDKFGVFKTTVSKEFKEMYERIAKETGLNFQEILNEQNNIFSSVSDEEFFYLAGSGDPEETAKRLAKAIIKRRCTA